MSGQLATLEVFGEWGLFCFLAGLAFCLWMWNNPPDEGD